MCCVVEGDGRIVLIDPGVALGFTRWGLHPHPLQAVFSEMVKVKIVAWWSRATDIIVTHLHGDHMPLHDANPFQLDLRLVQGLNRGARVIIGCEDPTSREAARLRTLEEALGNVTIVSGDYGDDCIEVCGSYPHGIGRTRVFIVRVALSRIFVHLSDTQLLVDEVIDKVREWAPDVVFTDGPPLYRYPPGLRAKLLERASRILEGLLKHAGLVVVDHHLLRCVEGFEWLDGLVDEYGGGVMCSADYMRRPRTPMEAWRRSLYEVMPADEDWFAGYKGLGEMLQRFGRLVEGLLRRLPPRTTIADPAPVLAELLEAEAKAN